MERRDVLKGVTGLAGAFATAAVEATTAGAAQAEAPAAAAGKPGNGLVRISPLDPDYHIPGRFAGKTFIVTGHARGMGAAAALRLACEGANVVGESFFNLLKRERIRRRTYRTREEAGRTYSITSRCSTIRSASMRGTGCGHPPSSSDGRCWGVMASNRLLKIVGPRRTIRNMIHPRHGNGNGGGEDARDRRSKRVAVQLCRSGGAHPSTASAAQDPAGGEGGAGQPRCRVRGDLHRLGPPIDLIGAANPGQPDPDPVLGPVGVAVDGADVV